MARLPGAWQDGAGEGREEIYGMEAERRAPLRTCAAPACQGECGLGAGGGKSAGCVIVANTLQRQWSFCMEVFHIFPLISDSQQCLFPIQGFSKLLCMFLIKQLNIDTTL